MSKKNEKSLNNLKNHLIDIVKNDSTYPHTIKTVFHIENISIKNWF